LGIVIGIILAFIYSWRMSLITLGLCPFLALGGFLRSRIMKKEMEGTDKSAAYYKESNALLSDIIINYRTVIAFGPKNIEYLVSKFDKLLQQPNKSGIKDAHVGGIFFGYTNCIRYIF
jgi:ATP-binding cassette subfamily B (MDR/TAP) protein 1